MRHCGLALLMLIAGVCAEAQVTGLSVRPFTDNSGYSKCKASRQFRGELNASLQSELIAILSQAKRYQFVERQVRPVMPEHILVGSLKQFEVCGKKRTQTANIAIEVQLLDAEGTRTHTFSGNARAMTSRAGESVQSVLKGSVREIAARIVRVLQEDRYEVPAISALADNDTYQLQMIRRKAKRAN